MPPESHPSVSLCLFLSFSFFLSIYSPPPSLSFVSMTVELAHPVPQASSPPATESPPKEGVSNPYSIPPTEPDPPHYTRYKTDSKPKDVNCRPKPFSSHTFSVLCFALQYKHVRYRNIKPGKAALSPFSRDTFLSKEWSFLTLVYEWSFPHACLATT